MMMLAMICRETKVKMFVVAIMVTSWDDDDENVCGRDDGDDGDGDDL